MRVDDQAIMSNGPLGHDLKCQKLILKQQKHTQVVLVHKLSLLGVLKLA